MPSPRHQSLHQLLCPGSISVLPPSSDWKTGAPHPIKGTFLSSCGQRANEYPVQVEDLEGPRKSLFGVFQFATLMFLYLSVEEASLLKAL